MKNRIKINREPIQDVVFDFIYDMALNDAIRRTDAASLKNEIKNTDEIKDKVRDYADSIVGGTSEDCKKVIEEIEEILRNKRITEFRFGNIQKLINMTMKYLYIRYYDNQDIRKNFDCCDAPMDRIMRDKVKDYYEEKGWGKTEFDPETAWSKIGKDENCKKYKKDNYLKFQDAVDRIIEKECEATDEKWNKIEFDYRVWE